MFAVASWKERLQRIPRGSGLQLARIDVREHDSHDVAGRVRALIHAVEPDDLPLPDHCQRIADAGGHRFDAVYVHRIQLCDGLADGAAPVLSFVASIATP
jgi:hypothetical protein